MSDEENTIRTIARNENDSLHWPAARVIAALDAARAQVATVRAIHQPVSAFGRKCCGACLGFPPWPCATIRALDAAPE